MARFQRSVNGPEGGEIVLCAGAASDGDKVDIAEAVLIGLQRHRPMDVDARQQAGQGVVGQVDILVEHGVYRLWKVVGHRDHNEIRDWRLEIARSVVSSFNLQSLISERAFQLLCATARPSGMIRPPRTVAPITRPALISTMFLTIYWPSSVGA